MQFRASGYLGSAGKVHGKPLVPYKPNRDVSIPISHIYIQSQLTETVSISASPKIVSCTKKSANSSRMRSVSSTILRPHLTLQQINVLPLQHLTYSTGPRGSLRLRRAAATFLTREFHPLHSITADDIFITPGLASAIDAVAWSVCNDGNGILVPQPFYNGFQFDLLNRSNTQVVPVSYTEVEGYSGLDDLFDPGVNRKALERALNKAREDGIIIRAVLVSKLVTSAGSCSPLAY